MPARAHALNERYLSSIAKRLVVRQKRSRFQEEDVPYPAVQTQ